MERIINRKGSVIWKVIVLTALFTFHFSLLTSVSAQKFALVDMEYIFKNIPAYERANEQLNQVSKKWQAEVDALTTEAQTLYKNYQEAADLKKKYFGPEGELFKKRTALMTPIQEEVYNAIKDVADLRGYQLVLDRASDAGIIYGSPKIDISSEVLGKLGYSK